MNPNIKKFWQSLPANKRHTLAKNPIFALYGHDLADAAAKSDYEKMRKKGLDPDSPSLFGNLSQLLSVMMQTEAPYHSQLEELAKDITQQVIDVPRNMLVAKLTTNVDAFTHDIPDQLVSDDYQSLDQSTQNEIQKRLILNSLTHGSSVHVMMTAHHMVRDQLADIHTDKAEKLFQVYDQLTTGMKSMYHKIAKMEQSGQIGSSKVEWVNGKPKVIAKAYIFPVLVQELIKGCQQLLTFHGLKGKSADELNSIYRHADDVKHEPMLIQVGPEIWQRLLKVLKIAGDNLGQKIPIAKFQSRLAKLPYDQLHKLIEKVINEPEEAEKLVFDLMSDLLK